MSLKISVFLSIFIVIFTPQHGVAASPLTSKEEGLIKQGAIVFHNDLSSVVTAHRNGYGGSFFMWAKASPEAVLAVATDWEKYPRLFKRVRICQVLEKSNEAETVEFKVNAIFFTLSYFIRVIIDKTDSSISWSLNPRYQNDVRFNDGALSIEKDTVHGGSRITYVISSDLSRAFFLPAFLKRYYMKREIIRALEELRRGAEKKFTL